MFHDIAITTVFTTYPFSGDVLLQEISQSDGEILRVARAGHSLQNFASADGPPAVFKAVEVVVIFEGGGGRGEGPCQTRNLRSPSTRV